MERENEKQCLHLNADGNCVLNHFLDNEWTLCEKVKEGNCCFEQVPVRKEWRNYKRRPFTKFKKARSNL